MSDYPYPGLLTFPGGLFFPGVEAPTPPGPPAPSVSSQPGRSLAAVYQRPPTIPA